jgi:hypothetical protein
MRAEKGNHNDRTDTKTEYCEEFESADDRRWTQKFLVSYPRLSAFIRG